MFFCMGLRAFAGRSLPMQCACQVTPGIVTASDRRIQNIVSMKLPMVKRRRSMIGSEGCFPKQG
jgi:hypothetical protein